MQKTSLYCCFLLILLTLSNCTASAIITTYSANIPTQLTPDADCTQTAKTVPFSYTSLYPTSSRQSPTLSEQEQIKKEAQQRLLHYLKLPADFDLKNCLAQENLIWQLQYNINPSRDSTDLRPQVKANFPQIDDGPEFEIEIRDI